MLQQTRVETVIPYYERFLARFPRAIDLAEAEEDEVLGMWSGLGYYRRARLLHRGVKEVVARYGAKVPQNRQDRLSLPGVGRYTAGAIGSIAFDAPEPVVDGNVSRVLTRLFRIETPLGQRITEKQLWENAEKLVQGQRPGDFNQALMELGATICLPKNPKCEQCPIRKWCRGFEIRDRLPIPKPKRKPRAIQMLAVVPTLTRPPRMWLERGTENRFGGLWSVPTMEITTPPHQEQARQLLYDVGISARVREVPCGHIEHILSHQHLFVTVWHALGAQKRSRTKTALRLVKRSEMNERSFGISKLTRKIIAQITRAETNKNHSPGRESG